MRKLEEVGFDESIEVIAKVFELLAKLRDNSLLAADSDKANVSNFANALRFCKDDIRGILATLNGVSAEEYNPSMRTLLHDLNQLVNDPEIAAVLPSSMKRAFSGSASGTTGDHES